MATITITETPAITVGDTVVDLINAQEWVLDDQRFDFEARRIYQVEEYKPYDKQLYVDLVIAEQEKSIEDRGQRSVERQFNVVIGVQKTLASKNDVEEVDQLANFVGALSDFFEFEVEISVGDRKVRCTDNRIAPICNPQELDTNNRFFALVHLTFDGWYDG